MFRASKRNYRPASIPPVISKIFEKLLSKQIIIYIWANFSLNINVDLEKDCATLSFNND